MRASSSFLCVSHRSFLCLHAHRSSSRNRRPGASSAAHAVGRSGFCRATGRARVSSGCRSSAQGVRHAPGIERRGVREGRRSASHRADRDNAEFDLETADRSNAGAVGSATSPPPHWLERGNPSRRTSMVIDPQIMKWINQHGTDHISLIDPSHRF